MVKFKGWGTEELTEYWGFEDDREWKTLNTRLKRYLMWLEWGPVVTGTERWGQPDPEEKFWAMLELRQFLKALEREEGRIGCRAGLFRWLRRLPDECLLDQCAKYVDALWT